MADPVKNLFQEGLSGTRCVVTAGDPHTAETQALVELVCRRCVRCGPQNNRGVSVRGSKLQNLLSQRNSNAIPPMAPVHTHPLQLHSAPRPACCRYNTHHFTLLHCHPQTGTWRRTRGHKTKKKHTNQETAEGWLTC